MRSNKLVFNPGLKEEGEQMCELNKDFSVYKRTETNQPTRKRTSSKRKRPIYRQQNNMINFEVKPNNKCYTLYLQKSSHFIGFHSHALVCRNTTVAHANGHDDGRLNSSETYGG